MHFLGVNYDLVKRLDDREIGSSERVVDTHNCRGNEELPSFIMLALE